MGLFGLLLCGLVHAQPAWALEPVPLAPGARCGFLGDCSRFDQIGLHLGAGAALRRDASRVQVEAQGTLRLSLTIGEVAEGGAALAGHIAGDQDGNLRWVASPVSFFARVRLLPLPLGPLAAAPLRLSLSYQHDVVAEPFGKNEPPGFSRGTLRGVAGWSVGRVDLDGSTGFVLAQPDGARPRLLAFELGASASVWLRRVTPAALGDELRLTAEALYRFSVESVVRGQGNLLLGLLGTTATGYGGGVAVGLQIADNQPGFLAVLRLQASWGKSRRNPWAERKAAEPKTTPAFIWQLLGAIDPVLGADGCVFTDPTPARPSTQWFCIGKPAPDDASQIVLNNGQRVAVGTHLWELGKTLRLSDGTKVVEIPLIARFRKAVWDFIDQNERESRENRDQYRRQVCEGKVSILHGADAGTASMIANDDFGGSAALLGVELLRSMYCGEDGSAQEQALTALSLLGAMRSRGPLRARLPVTGKLTEAVEQQAPAPKAGSGVPGAGVAEHVVPPRSTPALSAQARAHIYAGDVNKGKSTGWHYEPTSEAGQGTYVVSSTRSALDAHGVYEANVVIKGKKKNARSSFFPAHWTPEEVETAIMEAYERRKPVEKGPSHRFFGTCNKGIRIEMEVDGKGQITSAFPRLER